MRIRLNMKKGMQRGEKKLSHTVTGHVLMRTFRLKKVRVLHLKKLIRMLKQKIQKRRRGLKVGLSDR